MSCPPQYEQVEGGRALLVDGRRLAAEVRDALSQRIAMLDRTVRLDAVLVGTDRSAALYAENQARQCADVGIDYRLHQLPDDADFDAIISLLDRLNDDPDVHAIMVHMPLPDGVDTESIHARIRPEKDVEGVNPTNIGNIVYGRRSLVPCTALATLEMIESTGVPLKGSRCVLVGASNIVGKPVAVLLMRAEATVVSTNKFTTDLAAFTREADVLVAAAGVPGLITADMVKPGAVVIDVGINRVRGEDGRMQTIGDVAFDEVSKIAGAISPVPGGVGPLTVAMLLRNTVDSAENCGD